MCMWISSLKCTAMLEACIIPRSVTCPNLLSLTQLLSSPLFSLASFSPIGVGRCSSRVSRYQSPLATLLLFRVFAGTKMTDPSPKGRSPGSFRGTQTPPCSLQAVARHNDPVSLQMQYMGQNGIPVAQPIYGGGGGYNNGYGNNGYGGYNNNQVPAGPLAGHAPVEASRF